MFFAIASLGLPGLGNFIGEFLILLGTYQLHPAFAAVAALGVITAAAYSLVLVQRTFHGPPRVLEAAPDLHARHLLVMAVLAATIIWFGVYPQPVFNLASAGLANL